MHKKVTILFMLLVCLTQAKSQHDNAVQIAEKAGIPELATNSQTAGPFLGEQNTIYYLDNSGLITFFHPTQYFAYFGELNGNVIEYKYMLTPEGQYVLNHFNQAHQVKVLPNDVYRWPQANAVAQVLIQYLIKIKQGLVVAPNQSTDWKSMSKISSEMYQSTMSILGHMGDEGCTQHYEGVYYLGCW